MFFGGLNIIVNNTSEVSMRLRIAGLYLITVGKDIKRNNDKGLFQGRHCFANSDRDVNARTTDDCGRRRLEEPPFTTKIQ